MTINKNARAARTFSRRLLLRSAAAGSALALSPMIVRNAFSSSGELNFMGWAGYDFDPAFADFTKKTGIKVNFNPQPDQDAFAAQAAAGGADGGFDVSEPTTDRLANWIERFFIQPWDESKINFDGIEQGIREGSAVAQARFDGKLYASPSVWGTEGMAFNTEEVSLDWPNISLADLFDEQYAGRLTLRPHSGLVALGRVMEAEGKLPFPYLDSYFDESKMQANYDVIIKRALEIKDHVGQWWKDENSAQGAFRTNGCVIGNIWDSSAQILQQEELPIQYMSPKEGTTGWMQCLVLFRAAKNVAQAEAFVSWMNTAEGSKLWATAIGASPSAVGASDLMPEHLRKFLQSSFPGDALARTWWQPPQASWFVSRRNEYSDKFQAG